MQGASSRLQGIAALGALVLSAGLLSAAPAPDDEALQKRVLALNDVTGQEPINGEIKALVEDAPGTKKLLAVAMKMVKDKPDQFNYNGAYILARSAQQLKEWQAAEKFYRLGGELAVELGSATKMVATFGGLIDMLYGQNKFAESEKVCKEFLELRGDEQVERMKGLVMRRMIQAIAKQGKYEDATKIVDNLVKRAPKNWLVLDLKGWVQREAGDYAEAAKTYENVLELISKDEDLPKEEKTDYANDARYSLSNVYLELKKIDKVTEHLKALLEQEPDNSTYNNDLGYIWADNDMHLDEAEKMIRKALDEDRKSKLKLDPKLKPDEIKDNAAYVDSLGWVLFKKKQHKEAVKYLKQAVQDEEGKHLEIYDHLGDAHMALGEKEEALAAWKKGVETAGPSKREQKRKEEVEKKIKAAQ